MKKNKNLCFFIVTGEVSGDMYGALLSNALYKLNPDIRIFGMGGKRMEKAGVKLIADSLSISVVGFTELLPKLVKILLIFSRIKRFILQKQPSVTILIDYPGFNLRLARILKRNKIPVLYYIPPQVWAWNKKRVKKLASFVDRTAVILPFEKDWFRKEGYEVEYVGHPLMEILQSWRGPFLNKEIGEKIVGILPGSRKTEVKKILPLMLKTARLMKGKLRFILPLAPGIEEKFVTRYIKKFSVKVEIYKGSSLSVIKSADLLLVASGTATLEAAYFKVPMIIIYKVNWITYLLAKILVKVPWIGLVNLIAEKEIVPEFIQGKAKPPQIAKLATEYLTDEKKIEKIKKELFSVVQKLYIENTSEKVAKIALSLCKEV